MEQGLLSVGMNHERNEHLLLSQAPGILGWFVTCTNNVEFQCGEKLTESKPVWQNSSKGLSVLRLGY